MIDEQVGAMSPDRWRKIKELYHEALQQAPRSREAFLRGACAGDQALQAEVERLLAEEEAGTFLGELVPPEMRPIPLPVSNTAPVSGVASGQTIGHYRLEEKLGEGGMGVVYRAVDIQLDRYVALKFLSPYLIGDEEARRRFVSEAKAAAAIDHPNICAVYEIGQVADQTFLAMPYLEGATLRERIESGSLPVDEALQIAMEVANGLGAAHRKGIVHRDIKPANLMLVRSDSSETTVKILDFGLARLGGGSQITRTNVTLGTLAYMSPEQALGEGVDHRTDLWALGVVLYEMLTGQRPFRGEYDRAVMYAIANAEPAPVTEIRPELPQALDGLLARAIAKKPEDRFQSALELHAMLRSIVEGNAVSVAGYKTAVEGGMDRARLAQPTPRMSHREEGMVEPGGAAKSVAPFTQPRVSWLAILAGGFTLVACLVAAVLLWPGRDRKDAGNIPPPRLTPITSDPGHERWPSFSPDGTQIAYAWMQESRDDWDIYVRVIGAEQPLRLTSTADDDMSPAWSPDGKTIAFVRHEGDGKVTLITIPALGGHERVVTTGYGRWATRNIFGRYVTWTPDGNYLLLSVAESLQEPMSIFLVEPETGEKHRLTTPPADFAGDCDGTISSDGQKLVFTRLSSVLGSDLFIQDLSEGYQTRGKPGQLTYGIRRALCPIWTRGSREVIFSSGPEFQLHRISTEPGATFEPLPFGSDGFYPTLSSSGDMLAFVRSGWGDYNIWRFPISNPDSDSALAGRLIASSWRETGPVYSPDGTRIVLDSAREGYRGIWIYDADGTSPRKVASFPDSAVGSAKWSPDGKWIVFDCNVNGNLDIFTVPAVGGKTVQLTDFRGTDNTPNWSRDGRWIYFSSDRTGRLEVWKTPAQHEGNEKARQVTINGGAVAAESTDGRYIYYTKNHFRRTSLWRAPVDGGEEIQVLPSLWNRNFDVVRDGIFFIPPPNEDGSFEIRFFRFATEETKTVRRGLAKVIWGLSISPDRNYALVTQDDGSGSDLMLIENFR